MSYIEILGVTEIGHVRGLGRAIEAIDLLLNTGKYPPEGPADAAMSELSEMLHDMVVEVGHELPGRAKPPAVKGFGDEDLSFTKKAKPPEGRDFKSTTEKRLTLEIDDLLRKAMTTKLKATGARVRCPCCHDVFTKVNAAQIYCCNSGIGNCKDGFHQMIKTRKMQLAKAKGMPESYYDKAYIPLPGL